uniref:Zgc:172339 n=1 Tax=Scleropages formosus TaxID=113540 RepID=A0A8D0CM62_SCLFO
MYIHTEDLIKIKSTPEEKLPVLKGMKELESCYFHNFNCQVFLFRGVPPKGLQDPTLRYVCQQYHGKPRFLTLFDPIDHIPIYSAYIFQKSDGLKTMDAPWMFEPQLSSILETAEMQPFVQGYHHQLLHRTQAVLEDYANAVDFERGQLNPDEHHNSPDDKAATYSLTNVVPEASGQHSVWSHDMARWQASPGSANTLVVSLLLPRLRSQRAV